MNVTTALILFLSGIIAACVLIPIIQAANKARRRANYRKENDARIAEKHRMDGYRREAQEAARIRAAQEKHAAQAAKKSA